MSSPYSTGRNLTYHDLFGEPPGTYADYGALEDVVEPPPPPTPQPQQPSNFDPTDALTDEVLDALLGGVTNVTRRVDIYEEDGLTPWMLNAPLISGAVNIDNNRDERRIFDVVFDNADGRLKHYVGGFWYDKVLKPFRGVDLGGGRIWERQLGEFVVDEIRSPNFPYNTTVKTRDYTAKLMRAKFSRATTFAEGQALEAVVKTIAQLGGITKFNLPVTGVLLGTDLVLERSSTRWEALKTLSTAYGYQIYFDPFGYLTMAPIPDPLTGAESFVFRTGDPDGSLASYEKVASIGRLANKVIVYGTAAENAHVYAEVSIADSSPVSAAAIGERLYEYPSAIVPTNAQALALAKTFLKVQALEDYEISMGSVVLPFLDVNEVIRFVDPDPDPIAPTRFLVTSLNIPLNLEPMSVQSKRISLLNINTGQASSDEDPDDPDEPVIPFFIAGMQRRQPNGLTNGNIDTMKSLGATWIRVSMDFAFVLANGSLGNPTNGIQYPFEEQVDYAKSLGMKVLATPTYCPTWLGGNYHRIPLTSELRQAWCAGLAAVVAHYGNRIDAYEIWNEINHGPFNYSPSMATIRPFTRDAVITIRYVRPDAYVMCSGPASATSHEDEWVEMWDAGSDPVTPTGATYNQGNGGGSISQGTYFAGLYGEDGIVGGRTPGTAYLDAIGDHMYTGNYPPDHPHFENPRYHPWRNIVGIGDYLEFGGSNQDNSEGFNFREHIWTPNGDADKPVWNTEGGFHGGSIEENGSNGPGGIGGLLTETTAAEYAYYAWAFMWQKQLENAETSVDRFGFGEAGVEMYFELTDQYAYGHQFEDDSWPTTEDYLGMFPLNSFTPKLQAEVYKQMTGANA